MSTPRYRHFGGAALCERGCETSPLVRPARLERQKSCRTTRPRAMSQCSLGVRYSSRRALRIHSRIRMRFGSAGRTVKQSWRITPVRRIADRFCHRAWHTGHRASSPEGPVRLGQAPLDNRVHRDALSRIVIPSMKSSLMTIHKVTVISLGFIRRTMCLMNDMDLLASTGDMTPLTPDLIFDIIPGTLTMGLRRAWGFR